MTSSTLKSLSPSSLSKAPRDRESQPLELPSVGTLVMQALPMGIIHILAIWGLFLGASTGAWIACFVLWYLRMIGVTMGFHRYFSHRSFKTSRVFQFMLAVFAQTAGQRGILWWASHHRLHHKHSDGPDDPHSPHQRGVFWSHVGWLYAPGAMDTHDERIKDLIKYPELRFIDRFWWLPITVLGVVTLLVAGWSGFLIAFCLSTCICWHTTFLVNSLNHTWGTRPYATDDDSRNNFLIALLTAGEGWHNNHHYYQASARQGFHWWQIDVTWYCLKVLSWVGVVWDVREPPAHVIAGSRKRNLNA